MNGKFRLRLGNIEIDWEGDTEFLKSDLPAVLTSIKGGLDKLGIAEAIVRDERKPPVRLNSGTTSSVAAKLSVSNGPELFLAALAKLQLVDSNAVASRADILKEMQSTKSHYKKSYGSNLSQIIASLMTNGKINEPKTGEYTLTHTEQARIAGVLS